MTYRVELYRNVITRYYWWALIAATTAKRWHIPRATPPDELPWTLRQGWSQHSAVNSKITQQSKAVPAIDSDRRLVHRALHLSGLLGVTS